MKALPFPCIRPAQDRVLEALPAMGSILSGNDALRGALADGLMLKDPGAAYYVYECSGEPGRVTGVVAICPVNVLTGSDEAAAESVDALAAARTIAELKVQPRPVTLAYEASPVMDIILGAAKEGASLYAVTDPTGITHRVWEVKREDAVAAIRAMLDQAPKPTPADDPTYAAALAQILADEARTADAYSGKEPFNFAVAVLFPAAQVSGSAPQVPTGLLTHQVSRF